MYVIYTVHREGIPSTLKILLAAGTISSRCEAALSRSKQSQSGSIYKTITSMCVISIIGTSEMYIEIGASMIAFVINVINKFDNDTYHVDNHLS